MKIRNYFILFLILLLGSIFFVPKTFAQNNEDYASTINIEEIQEHMYFLASDFLGGRVAYENGFEIAANYCAGQFKLAGINPIYKDKEGKLSYFQEVPLKKKTFGTDCSVSLISSKETIELKHIIDFKMPDEVRNFSKEELDMVFIGFGINEPENNWNDYKDIDIKGKAVVMLLGSPSKNGKSILPTKLDDEYQLVKGFQKKLFSMLEMKPAAIIAILDVETLKLFHSWENMPSNVGGDQYSYAETKSKDTYSIPPIYAIKPESVNKLFKNQKYSPESIETKGLKGYKTYQFEDLKWKSNFETSNEEIIITKNIIGVLEGSDEKLKNEYIVLGAHLDHIPPINGQICNGADDNASGSVGLIEIAEAMKKSPIKRSIIFSVFTAEELGLIGSAHFVSYPPVPLENIKANINLDMIGRTSPENEDTKAHIIILHQKYFNAMKQLLSEVNEATINYPIIFEDAGKSGGDSDHSSFNNRGIPNMHFFSGHHKDLHMPTDDAENIDYEKMLKVTQLAYYFTLKMANIDTLPF